MAPRKSSSEPTTEKKAAKKSPKKAEETAAVIESPTGDESRTDTVPDPEPSVTDSAIDPGIDKMVVFFLAGQRYGLPIDSVQEIQQIVAFSEIPSRSGAVVGMVNLRGVVIPAVDMRGMLGLPPADYTLETPMIISRRDRRLVALIVDEVQDVLDLPPGCIQPPPAMHSLARAMIGVCHLDSGLVYLLDAEPLLAPLDTTG